MPPNKTNRAKKREKRPQSPELAGGAGFTFEDAVAAYFLSALLGESYARGIEGHIVSRIALQQRSFEEPLDDVVVDFRDPAGDTARLSLQVKRSLTISAAPSNADFREIIRDCWRTFTKPRFRKTKDRFGAAVGEIARSKQRAIISLCESARASISAAHFHARFAKGGNASAALKTIKKDIEALLAKAKGSACTKTEVHNFLAHFVLLDFDFLHAGASDPPAIMARLRDYLAPDHVDQAPSLWNDLRQIVRDGAGKSSEFDRPRLLQVLPRGIRLQAAASLRSDLDKITRLTRHWIADIHNDVGGVHVDRAALSEKLEKSLAGGRFIQITGLPGSGKSVLLRQRVEAELTHGPVLFLKSGQARRQGLVELCRG
jgi:hypothetical protein